MANELPAAIDEIVRDEAIRRRVQSIIEKSERSQPKPWERWTESSLGKFVLTGLVGGLLTLGFQAKSDDYKRDEERRDALRAEALSLVDTLGGLLGNEFYWYSRKFDSRKEQWPPTSDSVLRADSMFRYMIERGESRETVFAARVCAIAGADAGRRYWNVADAFRHHNKFVREYVRSSGTDTLPHDEVDKMVTSLQDSVVQFTHMLAEAAMRARYQTTDAATCPGRQDTVSKRMTWLQKIRARTD